MVKKGEKRTSAVKERQEREKKVNSNKNFDPLQLEVTQADTAILLLKCKEKSVLAAAGSALSDFAEKSAENRNVLFNLEVVESIIPLFDHEDIFTRRFAAKLLAQMATIPFVKNHLVHTDEKLSFLIKTLIINTDFSMQEFTLLIFVELTKDIYGASRFLEKSSDYNYLFRLIRSSDPNVTKNSLELIINLMREPLGVELITSSTEFSLQPVYKLLQNTSVIIQKLALDVIENLVMRCKDEYIQEIFRKSGGLQTMLSILENPECIDLHSEVLKILSHACNNVKTIELLINTGGMQKLFKYQEQSSKKMFVDIFRVIVKFADIISGRKALFSQGIVNYLLKILRDPVHSDVHVLCCYGIAKMTQYGLAAAELTQENPINNLLNLLKNENLEWDVRQAAAFALKELMQCDFQNCQSFLDINGPTYLYWLIKQTEKVSQETQITAFQILKSIAEYPNFREILIDAELMQAMCTPFESKIENDQVKIACCDTLSKLCIEEVGRKFFSSVNGVKRLYPLILETESIPVRDSAVKFIQQLSSDPLLADLFVQAEYLLYMLKHRSAAKIISTWDSCIESLMNGHLPIKFAYTGRLSMHDITQDGFYVLRRNVCQFPILEDLFSLKACPMESIYVVNFKQPVPIDTQKKDTFKNQTLEEIETQSKQLSIPKTSRSLVETSASLEDLKSEASEQFRRESICKGIKFSTVTLNSWLELKFGRLQTDPFLCKYLELLKCKLQATESRNRINQSGLVDISLIASRAKLLAEFVDRQLSGPAPTDKCVDHLLNLHLREIKCDIQTSVVPLGQLRLGSYLERALLFKVLADRIGLPTALVRGEYGKSWVEIAVPKIETKLKVEEPIALHGEEIDSFPNKKPASLNHLNLTKSSQFSESSQRNTIFPSKLLRVNYVVDLMNTPGDLIPIESKRAKEYCEKQWKIDINCCN